MAYTSAFRERLKDMENTRNQRLSLLQAEKELQSNKSLLLSAKFSQIRSLEQRCLLLDHKLALQNLKISSLKSEIDFIESKYLSCAQQLRDLRVEVEELEHSEAEIDKCYGVRCCEMQEFKDESDTFGARIRSQVQELRSRRDELKSRYLGLHKQNTPDIQAAELRQSELLALKEKMSSNLESNNRVLAELQKQLQSLR